MAGELYTTAWQTNISDITGSGSARTMEIYDKKVKLDISEKITNLDPDKAPFLRFLEALGTKESCSNYKFEWLEEDNKAILGNVKTGSGVIGSATSTDLQTDESDLFIAGDILRVIDTVNGTFETIQVQSKTSATVYVVIRNIDSVGALSTIADTSEVMRIGSAFAENTGAADPDSVEPVWRYNLTQNFKAAVEISGRFDAMDIRGRNSEIQHQLQVRMKDFMEGMEGAFLFGTRKYVTGSRGKTLMGGMKYFIDTYAASNNVDASSATFNQTWMDNQANSWFRYGSKKKLVICGGQTLSKVTSFELPFLRDNKQAAKVLGIPAVDYQSPHGVLTFVHSRLLDESVEYAKYMFILDPQYLKKRYLPGRDTQINMNVQNNDQDGKKHQILADVSLEVRNPESHFVITGLNNTIT